MTTYKDIMWHLTFQEIVQVPEVWTRCENREKQPYTASGRHWNFVVGHETIDKTVIDIVDMNTVSDNYIVALVDTGEKEIPVPIGLPMFGRDTCCSPACGSLQVHLESIWEDVRVEHARLFPSKNCMRDTPLDSRNFGSRRNELYVKVKVKSTRMQEDPRAATIETSA
ncbi:hypothetical protein FRC20_001028 [Serendipita sp. 405]|nr:hypothetical protein FRC15_000566 [Serendipita sp. 397]KAG8876690.1 hypothetical protein FRC20_001028 [Serendipita sp. 405]